MVFTHDISEGWRFSSKNNLFRGVTNLPSCNYLDLLKADYIPDPFVGQHEKELRWVGELDWVYEKTFAVTEEMLSAPRMLLQFDSIDTLADIFLNDVLVAKVQNAHLAYEFDIKDKVKEGENILKVYFYSPIQYVTERLKKYPMPPNGNGVNGFTLLRKAAYQFGWDWGPELPASGFDGKVRIVCIANERITNLRVDQNEVTAEKAALTVTATVEGAAEDTQLLCEITDPDGNRAATAELSKVGEGVYTAPLAVVSPVLWYANGMTDRKEQPLYTVTVIAVRAGAAQSEKEIKTGLRSLVLSTVPDAHGKDFCFVVNGARIFAKGANWIPADSFVARVTPETLEMYVQAMADSNFNMVRVWGGGLYASDTFLSLCDKYGILVWHDFMFACGLYPFQDEAFSKTVKEEVEYHVKRMRNYACLALLCGNNEMEHMHMAWIGRKKLVGYNKTFFYETLPQLIQPHSNCTYWQTSPGSGEYMKDVASDNVGDTHIWAVWHGMMPFTFFYSRLSRFCSEFGFESLPPVETVRAIVEKEEDIALFSPVMKAHQKCASGNDRILYYIMKSYRVPKSYAHLTYLSQLTQAESIACAVEHWRRNLGRCNGALYWQLNDCWHTASWSSIDYLGNRKALHYYAKEFFAPRALSLKNENGEVSVHLLNDAVTDFRGEASWRVVGLDGKTYYTVTSPVTAGAYTAAEIGRIVLKEHVKEEDFAKAAIVAELKDADGNVICTRNLLLVSENGASLKKPNLTVAVREEENDYVIDLSADTYVRRLMLEIPGVTLPFSTNYFDMESGKTYAVRIAKKAGLSAEAVQNDLRFISIADIVPRYARRWEKLKMLKVRLIPINFINRIVYRYFT